jgi:hypothetical protein
MKATCLLFLAMSWATLMQGTGYAAPSSPASLLSKLENSSTGQCGSAAPLCGKPLAFRPASPISLSQRRLEGAAFQATLRRLVNVQAPRKGEAFPQSGAAEPLGSIHPANERGDHDRASNMSHPPHRASLTKANRPKQLPNSRQRSLPGNLMNLHQPGSNKSGGAAKGGLFQSEPVNNALAVRTPSVVRPTVPSFNNARHRSPNPAVVSGSAGSQSRNISALNGIRMNRHP